MALEFSQKIFHFLCPTLIDIKLRSTQKIRNQVGKTCGTHIKYAWNRYSLTRTLNINRECEPMSAKNVDVTDSHDSANTILKNLRFENVNRLTFAQLNIN